MIKNMSGDLAELRENWNRLADGWKIQVGTDGDANRRLNSDPVLWDLVGDVCGKRVLDAGCGTGYLAAKLRAAGAEVVGVDVSDRMIELARESVGGVHFTVDSITSLTTQDNASFDLALSNYVLMDTPDLDGAMRSLFRVLRPGGAAVLVFSHPCFPQSIASFGPFARKLRYTWPFSYFVESRRVDPPWKHFRHEFVWYHRPLSVYFRAFRSAGFAVTDFEEPHLRPERYHLAGSEAELRKSTTRPYSVAFRLQKPSGAQEPL